MGGISVNVTFPPPSSTDLLAHLALDDQGALVSASGFGSRCGQPETAIPLTAG